MINPPLAENPLASREDLQRAVRDLFSPVAAHFSPGRARVRLGASGAHYATSGVELEAFSRPLWGLVPLAAGGGEFKHWDLFRDGLVHGTDPRHPEYWGDPPTTEQRHVEMAAIGLGLCLAPRQLWEPLSHEERSRLAAWLASINRFPFADTNWLFFRIFVNMGLAAVDAPHDAALMEQALQAVEKQYLGDGWYADGINGQRDYYVPFAMHFYGLVYAVLREKSDPARAALFRQRAALFARDFIYWFAPDGSALPFGRSLTYRFAQASFWSALAFAKVDVFPPGVVKGLVLRHLRHWFRRPIFTERGLLTIGYDYPNLQMSEDYNAPGSPYWALKTMLVLALPADNPFWTAEEQPLPALEPVKPLPHVPMIVCRDDASAHVVGLTGHHMPGFVRHSSEKYGKFAYSNRFGFCVATEPIHLRRRGIDNMLAFSEDGDHWRVRHTHSSHVGPEVENGVLKGGVIRVHWSVWPDVEIVTWIVPAGPWHVRVHHVKTMRALQTAEGGFAHPHTEEARARREVNWESGMGFAFIPGPFSFSGMHDPLRQRAGEIIFADANSNLLHPNSAIPALRGNLLPGRHWLAAAVLGHFREGGAKIWAEPPQVQILDKETIVSYRDDHWNFSADL
jgi:hypothetical protein